MAVDRTDDVSSPGALARVLELVKTFGWNSTAYQIINPGISHWFSTKGDAVIGYVQQHRIRVVAGAPVCAAERLSEVVAEFEGATAREGLKVCYFGAQARLEACLADSRRHSRLRLGVQPAWQPRRWPEVLARHASFAIASAFTAGAPISAVMRAMWRSMRQEAEWMTHRLLSKPRHTKMAR